MSKQRRNLLLIAALIIVLAIVGVSRALRKPVKAAPLLPTPNGYTAFVQAGKLVKQDSGNFATMDLETLRATVAGNSNALKIARAGLVQKSRVPVELSQAYISNHLPDLSALKELAFAFVAEGKLAEMEEHTNDAANSYLDAIHLGFESDRGGVILDALVGLAVQAEGTVQLQKDISSLDERTCADLARKIEMLDAQEESWDQILQNERNWSRSAFPGIQHWFEELFSWNLKKKFKNRVNAQQIKTHRMMIDLAARAYQLAKGHPPGSVADLVPGYLTAIPQDPVTGTPMTLTP